MSNETLQSVSQFVLALGIVLTGLGGWAAWYYGRQIEKEKDAATDARSANAGVIKPSAVPVLDSSKAVYPKMELSDSGATLTFPGPSGSQLFEVIGDNDLRITKENGQITVSATIRDAHGDVIARIQKNEWSVNPNRSLDRNYTSDTFEVVDMKGEVVLQVRALPDRIQIAAKMYGSQGRGIGVGKSMNPQKLGGVIELAEHGEPLHLIIPPLFRYPSAAHMGEFAAAH